jgi:YbbR domain-containing protein
MAVRGFRHHLGLKLMSLALAALLWFVVSGEQIVERALQIPLQFTNLPPELELVGDTPDTVDIRVRASSGTVSRISGGDLVAVVDLRSARPGRRLFNVTGEDVRRPSGVEVVQLSPSSVAISFESSATRTVPVVPSVEGEPASGFVIGTVTANPATVEVSGPASAVRNVTEAITEPVSVQGASGPIEEMVTVGVADPRLRLRIPQTARVAVEISTAPAEWEVKLIRVNVRNAARSVQVTPEVVTAIVRGPRELMQHGPEAFEAFVDADGLQTGQSMRRVRIVAPERAAVVRVEPEQIRVRVR